MSRLQKIYSDQIVSQLVKQFDYKSPMQAPRLSKITINMGVGEAIGDKKVLDNAVADLEKISGQKVMKTLARKSVASFKVRDGYPVGCKVTLRGSKMYEFLDRLINIALPRVRDFRGLNGNAFDGRGNYNLGVKEQIIFPEIEFDKIDKIRGMDINFATTANSNAEAKALLEDKGISYEEIEVANSGVTSRTLRALTNQSTVPQVFIEGKHIGGSDDLEAYLA